MLKTSRQFYSIIISGPFSSGKSTLMKTACSQMAGFMLSRGRCIDVGQFALNDKLGVYLYETNRPIPDLEDIPGQRLGCVVIVNNRFPETFREAKSIIETYRAFGIAPITVVANPHSYPEREAWTQEDIRFALRLDNTNIPVIECDVSKLDAVKVVLDMVGQQFLSEDNHKLTEGVPLPNAVIDEADFFTDAKVHRFLPVVGTHWSFQAHDFMDKLADQITWLKLNNRTVPCRWGYCEVDATMNLHIVPVDRFGTPRDFVGFAIQNFMAMAGEAPAPSPVEEHMLPDNEETLGYIGLFNSDDEQSVTRARYMVKAFGDNPYVLIDVGRGDVNEAALGSRHPIMNIDSDDWDFSFRAVCLLNEQLKGIEAEKLRAKFYCLK